MVLSCKGLCDRLPNIIKGGNESLYKKGFKRSTECNIYILLNDNRCPCCKYRLRWKRREKPKQIIEDCLP